jgi:hypothetical protein
MKEKHFCTGNLVMWEKELWIVGKWDWPHCELISCNSSNVIAGPSNKWPYKKVFVKCYRGYDKDGCGDKCDGGCEDGNYKEVFDSKKGIGSVKFVADTLLQYVERSSRQKFVGLEMGRGW